MRQKSEQKHAEKKSSAAKKTKIAQNAQFLSAEALKPYTGLDDSALRRLSNVNALNPSTNLPWIPKPRRGEYEVIPTLLGAIDWWRHQATKDTPDHPTYSDMEEAETRGLVPREFQKYAKSRGVDFINLNRTIKIEPLRQLAFHILRKITSKQSAGMLEALDGEEYLNSDAELAKLRREQRLEIARSNAEAEGLIHNKERIEEVLWENAIAPLRAGIISLRKTAFAQVDAELDKAEVSEPVRAVVKAILVGAIENLLAQIRNGFPQKDPSAKEKS